MGNNLTPARHVLPLSYFPGLLIIVANQTFDSNTIKIII
jgi:hypothetical protein